VRELPAEAIHAPPSDDNDAVVLQADLDFVTRMQLDLITDRLGDHDLSLLSDLAGYTE
jgi:hypothetical protein